MDTFRFWCGALTFAAAYDGCALHRQRSVQLGAWWWWQTLLPGTSTWQLQSPADLLSSNNHGHKQELQVRILDTRARNELPRSFSQSRRRVFSLLKAPTSTFTLKNLLRHYAKLTVEAFCDFQYCSDETRLFANFDVLIRENV